MTSLFFTTSRTTQGFAWIAAIASLLAGAWLLTGCGGSPRDVVVYCAQDRVFADPLFRRFEQESGLRVLPLHDAEATKTTGLANRLMAEARHPQADLWWSNEEMRTWQLARRGVLETNWLRFGSRQRVLVIAAHRVADFPQPLRLDALVQPDFTHKFALAYPVFGTTATHLLVLRQRWGRERWETWCRQLLARKPWIVDGNSVVVRLVAQGAADLGLTDSDDVAFARREGLAVVAVPLPSDDALALPNTVALTRGAPHPDSARRLAEFLTGTPSIQALTAAGAIDGPWDPQSSQVPSTPDWNQILDDLDPALAFLTATFVR